MGSRTFADDYRWQLQFEPAVTEIITDAFGIGEFDVTFTRPDSDDDRRFNTDILVRIDGNVKRVSQRLRTYLVGDDFTMRYARPSSLTEWQKLWAGYGDFYLYGQGTARRTVENWFLGDLGVFRRWANSFLRRGEPPPHIEKSNRDGSSTFVAFSRADLPPEFTIAEDPDAGLRDVCWTIVRDGKGMSATGHASTVRWARAVLGLDE